MRDEPEIGSLKRDKNKNREVNRRSEGERQMTSQEKRRGNRNALLHGVYARDITLPWEANADLEKMHADFTLEFNPKGRAEQEAVLDLTVAHWQKHNLWFMRQIAVLKDPFSHEIIETGRTSQRGIRKKLRETAKSVRSIQSIGEEIFNSLRYEVQRANRRIEKTSDPETVKLLEQKLDACLHILTERALPFLTKMSQLHNPENTFDNSYAPDCLEKLFRLETVLDGRIAKILGRLVALKEFKRTPAGSQSPQIDLKSANDFL